MNEELYRRYMTKQQQQMPMNVELSVLLCEVESKLDGNAKLGNRSGWRKDSITMQWISAHTNYLWNFK